MISAPDVAFQGAIRERIQPFLKQAGFSKKGGAFTRALGEVVQVVAFQKSGKTTADEIIFAVNLGVASCQLLVRGEQKPAATRLEDCHWRRRLGSDATGETWWRIVDGATAASAGDEVVGSLRMHGLPALDQLRSDRALRDLWLSGKSPGLTDVQRLVSLTVLLQNLGPIEELSAVLDTIKEMVRENPLPILLAILREAGVSP